MWVYLEDVYWSREGRSSLDAVVITAAFMALVVIGIQPLGLGGADTAPLVAYAVVQTLVLSVISFLKGRIGLGVLAIFVPLFGLWAALRLAKPSYPWARRFYAESKLERSRERYPPDRRGARFRNAFFGRHRRPTQPTLNR